MAIDARISMMGKAPNVGQAINIFESAMMNSQTRESRQAQELRATELQPFNLQQAQQGVDINQQTLDANQEAANQVNNQRILKSVNDFAIGNQSIINQTVNTGDPIPLQQALIKRRAQLVQQGLPTEETDEGIAMLSQGNIQGVVSALSDSVSLFNQGRVGQQKQFAVQKSAPITDPVTGQVSTPIFDPNTQTTSLIPIDGAIQETPTQVSAREFKSQQQSADLDVKTTERKETIKKTAARTSALKTEFSVRRRLAARSTRKIKEAQKLSEKATQGLGGAGLVQLARAFPGIDVGNESALTGAFKSLALDELQKFTGPTTDFEFRVTEDIAGSLGDGASANNARLASLERANWFIGRESKQFNDHVKAGHDPDEFFFDFNELVTPKSGGKSYSLQSLQDTAVANHISIDEVIKRLSK
jgi:hypothetical protein